MGIIKNMYQGYKNLIQNKTIPEEKRRLKICNSCEFKKPGVTDTWCMKCPCNMAAKVKAPGAHCKIGKW